MRIVLFYPRGSTYSQDKRNAHHLACVLPPAGLVSIAAVLRKNGHDVCLFDAALFCTVSNERWADKIINFKPDIAGFSTITSNFNDAYDVCQKIKRRDSSITTVLGGVHASWGKDRLLEKFDAIDIVVAGEGEAAMCEIAAGKPAATIEGVFARNGSEIIRGPNRRTMMSMDDLPFPAFDLLDGFPKKYLLPLFSYPRHPGVGIASSRGCVHQCSYCDRSVFGRSFRWNSPEYTVEHIRKLKKDFGVRHVTFHDDQFITNRPRVERLCALLREKKLGVTFNCVVRLGSIDADLAAMLKASGCWMVSAGIESGDQTMLDEFKSGVSLEELRRDTVTLANAGLYVKGLFMAGFPGETESSLTKTMDFAISLPLKDINVTAFTPFPGAPIFHSIDSLGSFINDWNLMDCEHTVFVPRVIPSAEYLETFRNRFIKTFYNRRSMRKIYMEMLWKSPHSYWRLIKNAGVFLKYSKTMR
jgi:anaerobic magnesium-protoporphyrin IX monomethyl ester cyclase